jgi:hypothetical protein
MPPTWEMILLRRFSSQIKRSVKMMLKRKIQIKNLMQMSMLRLIKMMTLMLMLKVMLSKRKIQTQP